MVSFGRSSFLALCTLVASAFALVPVPSNVTLASRAGTFTNPLNQQRGADPCLRFINGRYFLTSTQNTNIAMRTATTIEGLKTATSKVLFSDSTAGRNFDFWAPEFWYLNGNWFIYYAVAGNGDDNTHRLHVLRGGTDANDPSTGPYTYVNSLIPQNFNQWAVDGSILQLNNQLYFLFSGQKTPSPWTQCTYIVKMTSPTQLSGNAVEISCPTQNWEKAATPVQEGPEAITVNGVTHIVYSGGHCSTDDYALGMLTLTTGADPMVASSWTKNPNPVFTKNTAAGVYGPGHHFMFQVGSNWYFAYHGKSAPGLGCGDLRTTRVQPFTVSGGTPVFPAAIATGVAVPEPQ
ncbi:Arabinanase/levansucrase/invertase [Marasmius fiardii PR-910]|nr:Arabinanase/levansucrase/invertase [Marasmius fiardii PR-910]